MIKSMRLGFSRTITLHKVSMICKFYLICFVFNFRYVLVYKKGYQEFDIIHSSVTTKVKGVAFSNHSNDTNVGRRTWDVADYVIPPQVIFLFSFKRYNIGAGYNEEEKGQSPGRSAG